MNKMKYFALLITVVALIVAVNPVSAQLGTTDTSSFTVQNVSGGSATVTVTFYNEAGTAFTPTSLGGTVTNPFTLNDGVSQQVNVANIPIDQLPSGRYSVVIQSTALVIAQAGLAGTGSRHFNGSYISSDAGATTVYIPSAAYNLAGWYSMITVQNLGAISANVTVTITCLDGSSGTLNNPSVPSMASVTWALKNIIPTGFTSSTHCDGSAVVTSGQPVIAINNQNNPSTGATNTFEGAATGATTLYVANLSSNFFGWNSNLTITKLDAGDTTVTVSYSDGATPSTCNLTDAIPFCKLYQPTKHPASGRYGATITSSPTNHMLAIIGSTNGSFSGAVSAVLDGAATNTVAIPNAAKNYYGWNTAINCQIVGGGATTLHMLYSGYTANAYDTESLSIGGSKQILVANESFLPTSWQGGVTITANNTSAQVACTVGNTNAAGPSTTPGDWTTQYNAYNK